MENVVPLRDVSFNPEDFKAKTSSFRYPFVLDGTEQSTGSVRWLVKNLLISGGMSVVYGPPKSGKSFVSQDIAYRTAHGLDFFGRKTSQGLVVYLCGEGAAGFRQRMTAWRKINDMAPSRNFVMMPAALDIVSDDDAIAALISDLKTLSAALATPICMIVVDTLARYFGPHDEDRAADMSKFVTSLSRIQDALERQFNVRPHMMLVHHTGKDVAKGMRGSNALLGAADCTIEVTTKGTDGVRQARVVDIKDAAPADPMFFKLKSTAVGVDEDGETEFSCAVEATTIEITATIASTDAPAAKRGRGRPRKDAA